MYYSPRRRTRLAVVNKLNSRRSAIRRIIVTLSITRRVSVSPLRPGVLLSVLFGTRIYRCPADCPRRDFTISSLSFRLGIASSRNLFRDVKSQRNKDGGPWAVIIVVFLAENHPVPRLRAPRGFLSSSCCKLQTANTRANDRKRSGNKPRDLSSLCLI